MTSIVPSGYHNMDSGTPVPVISPPRRPWKKRRDYPGTPQYPHNSTMPRSYRRRSSRPSRRYGRNYPSPHYKHLKIYNDPFFPANNAPKIPDGKTVQSIGYANRATYQVNVTQPVTNILLFPGIDSCAYVLETDTAGTQNLKIMHLSDKNSFVSNATAASDQSFEQPQESAIHRWRNVSLGMHISLTNNAEENDGWWEACRFGTTSDARDYIIATQPDKVNIVPFLAANMTSSEMAKLPSYVNGDLRDIKFGQFSCRPEGNEHDFVKLRNEYSVNASGPNDNLETPAPAGLIVQQKEDAQGADVALTKVNRFREDNAKNHQIIEQMVDLGWDCVLVRIHGRVLPTGNVGRNSSLRVTIAQNQEIIYDERSINSRFHTKATPAPNFKTKQGPVSAVEKTKTA